MDKLLKTLESQVRAGEHQLVRKQVSSLNYDKIPRPYAVRMSSIARRVGLEYVSIRIMNHLIRPKIEGRWIPTPEEYAEYARALLMIGSYKEAGSLLAKINAEQLPQALLFKAFLLFGQWNYLESLQYLRKYVIHPQVEPYQRLVGKLNLAAALVPSGHYNEAIDLLSELESTLDPQKQLVLLSNTFEVRTQAELFRGDYAKAKIYLDRARSTHSFGQQIMGLIFKKWQIILDWKIKGNSSSIEDAIIKLQDHARENSFYELVRDCDYYRSQMTENADLYDRLILGTAHPNYGLRFRNTVFEDRKASASYLWMGDGSTSAPEQVIDMANAKSIDGSLILKPKQIHYQLIRLLSTDFYRPFKLGEVFESLFEDQYFDPHSSPQRVYMAVSRLRSFLKKAGYAANLTDASEGYLFRPTSGFGVLVHKEMKDEDPRMVYIRRLQGEFGFDDFNSAQAGGVLDLSARQSITILNWAIANDLILQSGRGKATHYSIKGRTTKAA